MMFRAYLIDVHTHFPTKEEMQVATAQYANHDITFPGTWDPRELENYLRYSGISKFFVINYALEPGTAREINEWTEDVARHYQQALPFGTVHPHDDDAADEIHRVISEKGFYGICIALDASDIDLDGERLATIYDEINKYKKPVYFVVGPGEQDTARYEAHIDALASRHPGMIIVVGNGCYTPLTGKTAEIPLLDKHAHVYYDTARMFSPAANIDYEALLPLLEKYQDKFVYGSGFPFTGWDTYEQTNIVLGLKMDAEALKKLKFGNAEKILLPPDAYEKLMAQDTVKDAENAEDDGASS